MLDSKTGRFGMRRIAPCDPDWSSLLEGQVGPLKTPLAAEVPGNIDESDRRRFRRTFW